MARLGERFGPRRGRHRLWFGARKLACFGDTTLRQAGGGRCALTLQDRRSALAPDSGEARLHAWGVFACAIASLRERVRVALSLRYVREFVSRYAHAT